MIYKANDKYRANLRSTWTYSPADGSLLVDAIPDNTPTLVVVGWGTEYETVFSVTGSSGSSAADYALTGVTRLRGYEGNLAENLAVNCLNNEEFFNQYSDFVNDEYLQMEEQASAPSTPASGFLRLYADATSSKWKVKNDAGVVATLGELSDEWIDVSDAATMDFDLSSLTNKLKFLTGALGGNRTFTLSNPTEGQVFLIRVRQDGTGSRTVTWFEAASETVTITEANPGVVTTTIDMKTGTPVKFTTTDTLPTNIVAGTTYYWIRTGATTGNLASTKANALAGTAIDTSGSVQAGTHTMGVQIIWDKDVTPTLSTDKYAIDDIEFVVESTGQIYGRKLNGLGIRVLEQNGAAASTYRNTPIVLTGWGSIQGGGNSGLFDNEVVSFGLTFTTVPIVLACFAGRDTVGTKPTTLGAHNEYPGYMHYEVYGITTSGFNVAYSMNAKGDGGTTATTSGAYYGYTWIAIGS